MKNLYLSFCKFATLALMLGLTMKFLGFQSNNLLVQADSEENVTICHATSSYSNPYTNPTVDKDSIIDGGKDGHDTHNGPIFYAEIPKHTDWGDIIPAFSYGCQVVDVAEHWGDWQTGKCSGGDKKTCEERTETQTDIVDKVEKKECKNNYHLNEAQTLCVKDDDSSKTEAVKTKIECPDGYKENKDTDKCEKTITIEQHRNLIPTTYKNGTCNYDGKNWDEEGQSIHRNGCVAPDACQETVKCDDACRTEDVTIQGSCDPIICERNAESCDEEEDPTNPSMSSIVSCGKIDMTFRNPTRWFFSFDYRVDEEDGTTDSVSHLNIANGPWAGQSFGLRYNIVDVLAGQVEERTVTFAEDSGTHKVEYRLWRGAENDMYLNWVSKTVESDCQEPSASPSPSPTPTASPSPAPTEPPGYTCPVAQSCPTSCGQSAKDVPNGSCGLTHCGPTAPCDGGVGGVETSTTGQVLGTTTLKSVATSSGQVLGATTYAATGIAEDIAFSLIGLTGAGLSGVGILLKRNEKNQK